MITRLLIGDVFDRMAELEDHSFDFIITSPPFLALRSYLPDGHPLKDKEIGSEATPAEYLDVLLALTAEWRRLLAPYGSLCVEIGDTYAGSGGAGGDYGDEGWREGQLTYKQQQQVAPSDGRGPRLRDRRHNAVTGNKNRDKRPGWPLDKSLCGIPTLYTWSLAYGRNLLTGQPSPAGQWRIRNLKPWIRSNPPVGALGDKERPATSYITVACTSRDRWFDLDAVRTASKKGYNAIVDGGKYGPSVAKGPNESRGDKGAGDFGCDPGGAPPLDWWHHVDAIIDHEIDQRAGKPNGGTGDRNGKETHTGRGGSWSTFTDGGDHAARNTTFGAHGVHIRRALERAGILTTLDAHDISPRGYTGAHYAVWPPELVKQLVDEMCPRRVCTVCGQPSRRLTKANYEAQGDPVKQNGEHKAQADYVGQQRNQNAQGMIHGRATKHVETLGWSDCGHNTWRLGRILDPFVGSGTTLAVASGMSRDSIGVDIDERSADLASERCGMFLEVDYPTREETA